MQEMMLMKKMVPIPVSPYFQGEVPSADFINGPSLASAMGLTAGTAIVDNAQTPWFNFLYNGKTIMIPKLPLRYGVSWIDLYNNGSVYGDDTIGMIPAAYFQTAQNRKVTIGSKVYRVRLFKATDARTSSVSQEAAIIVENNEFNDIFYPILRGDFPGWVGDKSSTLYDYADLGMDPGSESTTATIEMSQTVTTYSTNPERMSAYMGRRLNPANRTLSVGGSSTVTHLLWRPWLELVP